MCRFDVLKCADRLLPYVLKTPLVESETLSELTARKIYLKLETFQKTGAFKVRGAMNFLLGLCDDAKKAGVVTASSGNHALGMSFGSSILGIPATAVMPFGAPEVKRCKAEKYGAEVILHGCCYDEAAEHAYAFAKDTGRLFVPSFDDFAIIEGQGTILKEILDDLPDVGLVVAPIGGGGLVAGLLSACRQIMPGLGIVGAEPEGAAAMAAAIRAGSPVTLDGLDTGADGVAVKRVGDLTFQVVFECRPEIVIVTDEEIKRAQLLLLREAKVVAELAGSVPVAALFKMPPEALPDKVVCVITGANLDPRGLAAIWVSA